MPLLCESFRGTHLYKGFYSLKGMGIGFVDIIIFIIIMSVASNKLRG
jgi:hypothetical protein